MFISTVLTCRVINKICMIDRGIGWSFVEIKFDNIKMSVAVKYHTQDANIGNFGDYSFNFLESLNPIDQSCYLMVDYNIVLQEHCTHNPHQHLNFFISSFLTVLYH